MAYKHKTTGATYKPRKAIDGGVIFHVSGGNGDHKWMDAILFMSDADIVKNLVKE